MSELVKIENTNSAQEPMQMIQLALQNGASPEVLTQMLALKERWEAGEARKAFVASMAQFKANPPKITKNKKVNFTTQKGTTAYSHASLDHVCDIIGAELAKVSISYRWETEQLDSGVIKVRCILTHSLGHHESSVLQAVPDNSGNKNSIQAVGSTVTYLQRYTLLAVTGMATEDQDDDGRGAGSSASEPAEQVEERFSKAQTVAELVQYFNGLKPATKNAFHDKFKIRRSELMESK